MTSEEILVNARALVPEIQRCARETSRLRRLPADLVEKLRAAGVFRKFALARAQMLYGAARAAVYESVSRYWEELLRDGHGSLQTRRDMGLARIHAHRTAREVAQLMFDTVGAPAVYQNLPLGSLLHDAIVMNQHLGFNDGVVERLGGMLLGDPPDGAFV